MKKILFGIVGIAAALTLVACSKDNPTPAPSSSSAVSTSSVVSSTVETTPSVATTSVSSTENSSSPETSSTSSVSSTASTSSSAPVTTSSPVTPSPAPSATCVQPTPLNVSFNVVGNVLKVKVVGGNGQLCQPVYVKVQNWKYLAKGQKYPQAPVNSKSFKLTKSVNWNIPALVGQQDFYASLKSDFKIPSRLTAKNDRFHFLDEFATGTPNRFAPFK